MYWLSQVIAHTLAYRNFSQLFTVLHRSTFGSFQQIYFRTFSQPSCPVSKVSQLFRSGAAAAAHNPQRIYIRKVV